ncbi:hypothetical protein DPMN_036532 [Dreissena polymorpha]|uniref:Uncharacterized protein n=1 Tax=Dreissena polymorpha TaxID=45954 RepID=A0A9D4RNY7_DREPO|nr:hypothetical protein DPMN_036532 [Dreissena polymorpha]
MKDPGKVLAEMLTWMLKMFENSGGKMFRFTLTVRIVVAVKLPKPNPAKFPPS